jgi:hypothetical protein
MTKDARSRSPWDGARSFNVDQTPFRDRSRRANLHIRLQIPPLGGRSLAAPVQHGAMELHPSLTIAGMMANSSYALSKIRRFSL